MATLEPLLQDVDIREYKGRFLVQLEIPKSSSLTNRDIDKIGALSSWDLDPNKETEGYEGVRSVLVSGERAITKKDITLEALQISGIGYKDIIFRESLATTDNNGTFHPPTNENFIEKCPSTIMSTSYAENGVLVDSRPTYRALGTYIFSELRTKLEKTIEASGFNLDNLVTPNVEAYGRFLDSELKNEEGNFGFIVFPVPSVGKERIGQEILKKYLELATTFIKPADQVASFYTIAASHIGSLSLAARELHDKTRVAHLQLHLSNAYLIDKLPCIVYIMDWSTMVKLGENRENNIINRAVDLVKPFGNFKTLFSKAFPSAPKELSDIVWVSVQEAGMELYSGRPEQEVNVMDLVSRAESVLGGPPNDFDVIVQWMKDLGVEGFDYVPESKKRSSALRIKDAIRPTLPVTGSQLGVGRNDPCPCGSRKKYKKCCGRHV